MNRSLLYAGMMTVSVKSFHFEFDAAVLSAAFLGVIGGDGMLLAIAHGGETACGDALADEVIDDALGTLLGEGLVVLDGTHAVGMSADLKLDRLVEFQVLGDLVELLFGLVGQFEAVEVEEGLDIHRLGKFAQGGFVGQALGLGLGACNAVETLLLGLLRGLFGCFGAGDAVLLLLLGLLRGFFRGLAGCLFCGELRSGIVITGVALLLDLSEHHPEADGAAEVGGAFLGTVGERITAQKGGLQVGNNADARGNLDGHHNTDATGRAALMEMGVTAVDVGNEPVGDPEEEVGVAVVEGVFAVFSVLLGNAQALIAGAETEPVVEELTEIGLHGGACSDVGVFTVDEGFSFKAEVHTAAGTDEPPGVALGLVILFLCKGRNRHQDGGRDHNDILEFHSRHLLKVETKTERGETADIQREAGIAFLFLNLLLGRFQTVEIVGKSLTGEIGIDADGLTDAKFGDEADT